MDVQQVTVPLPGILFHPTALAAVIEGIGVLSWLEFLEKPKAP